jgi:propionyl-CoA carboxylase alpha chain
VLGALPPGWRNVPSQPQRKDYEQLPRGGDHAVRYRLDRSGLLAGDRDDIALISMAPDVVELQAGGIRRRFEIAAYPDLICVDSSLGPVALRPVSRFADPASQVVAGSLLAPMPGTVVRLGVTPGQQVAAGQPLLWLEAMKMEHVISAPAAGIVAELPVAAGQQVQVGSVLAVVRPQEDPE